VRTLSLRFGIYTNPEKDLSLNATKTVIKAIEDACCEPCLDEQAAGYLGEESYTDAMYSDVLFILGGDGTILRAVHKYVRYGMLFAGINIGHLGFMSEIDINEIDAFISLILHGKYVIDKRTMLEAAITSQKKRLTALNDFVITRKNRTNIINLDLYINNTLAENYKGDGIIIATPTGSTAYSLSAGGPIVSPNMDCMIVTPICPHSLYARSIVTKNNDIIKVAPYAAEGGMFISGDGNKGIDLFENDRVSINVSDMTASFVRSNADSFFPQLKSKLAQWNNN